jgi:DNA polymerase III alpha subunit
MIKAILGGIVLLSAVLLAAGTTVTIEAQRRSPTGTAPTYDVATEVTLTGTVDEVKTIPGPGLQGGVHLMLRTAQEEIEVDLGPEEFLKKQNYRLNKGDDITVIGSRVKRDAGEAVIARQVTRGKETMTFRDAKGFPRWSGGARF